MTACSRGLIRSLLAIALALAFCLPAAASDDPLHCRAARARARADASVLLWPQLVAQVIRYPSSGIVDTAASLGAGRFQVRTGLALSLVDLYRGLHILGTVDADCDLHEAQLDAELLLTQAEDVGALAAARQELAWLTKERDRWRGALAQARQSFAAHLITLLELAELEDSAAELERKLVRAEGEAARLAARGATPPGTTARELARRYVERAERVERRDGQLRASAAWQLKVTAGIVSNVRPVDWYGVVELGINLGTFMQVYGERKYLDARTDSLRSGRGELAARLDTLAAELQAKRTAARRELDLVEARLASIGNTLHALRGADAPRLAHAQASLTIAEIRAQVDAQRLCALIEQLSVLIGDDIHAP